MGMMWRVLNERFKEAQDAIQKAATEKITKACILVQNQAKENLSHEHLYGRTYYVPGTRRKYTASSPHEFPATATGTLKKTVAYEVQGEGDDTVGFVGSAQKYAPWLEFGTKNMEPRPWLRPSFEQSIEGLKAIMGEKWVA